VYRGLMGYIYHTGQDRVFWKDLNLAYRGGNELFIADAGVPDETQLVGKTVRDMPWQEERDVIEATEQSILAGLRGGTKIQEVRTVSEGRRIAAMVYRIPLFDTAGRIAGILGCYRYQSSDGASTPLFILDAIPFPAAIYDHREGWIVGNEKFLTAIADFPQEERTRFFHAFSTQRSDDSLEIRYTNKAGQQYAFICQFSHRLGETLAIFINVRDFVQAEEELLKANEWLKAWIWELEIHNRKLEILHQMGFELQQCDSFMDARIVLKRYLPRLFEPSSGCLYVINAGDPLSHHLHTFVTYGDIKTKETIPKERCLAFRRGTMILGHGDECCACLNDPTGEQRPMSCLPMTIASRSIGVMNIQWEGEEREFVENELFLVATEYITLVLANLQLRDELTHQATRDALTNLYNRRYMEEA